MKQQKKLFYFFLIIYPGINRNESEQKKTYGKALQQKKIVLKKLKSNKYQKIYSNFIIY